MGGLNMKVDVNDILNIYEKEICKNTKNKKKLFDFEKNKMENIFDIVNVIENNNYHINKYNIFSINKPKYRIIMSLNIKDKVINHYVARYILLNKLDKYLDIRNCATRKNMGYDYAIKLLKKYIELNKKYDNIYALRIDISKYFYNIDHNILKKLLVDKLTKEEYSIICSIIDSTNLGYVNYEINRIKNKLIKIDKNRTKEIELLPEYKFGKGLPIGNMTSQFLSIFYLYKLDYYIINNLKLKYMVKYMDDYVILCNNKEYLIKCFSIIKDKLEKEYLLNININKSKIYNINNGFEYLGYVFRVVNKRTIIRMKSSNKRRIINNIKSNKYLYNNGYISFSKYFSSIFSYKNINRYIK